MNPLRPFLRARPECRPGGDSGEGVGLVGRGNWWVSDVSTGLELAGGRGARVELQLGWGKFVGVRRQLSKSWAGKGVRK